VQPEAGLTPLTRGTIQHVPIESIIVEDSANPRRRLFGIDALAASIQEHGLLQPLVVRQNGDARGRYYLVAGHRRMAALQVLAQTDPGRGEQRVPVMVREEEPHQAYLLTLIENLQRDDLSPREEAEALGRLVRERGWSTRQVAAAIHRSQAFVSRRLRVYEDRTLRPLVLSGRLSASVAEELLATEPPRRAELARRAVRENWDQKRARAEARGYTAPFHPQLRVHANGIRQLATHASLSTGERELLRDLGEFLMKTLA
jgi:ParB family chromosome partitioning protein